MLKTSLITSKKLFAIFVLLLFSSCSFINSNSDFTSNFPKKVTRTWIGPEYWANPLQDWQLNDGRIECAVSGGDRNVFLLTHELGKESGNLKMSVQIGRLNETDTLDTGWIGFKVGVRGEFEDYRDNAVRGDGLPVGITTAGQLFIGQLDSTVKRIDAPWQNVRLELSAKPDGVQYHFTLVAIDEENKELARIDKSEINADWLVGGFALVASFGKTPEMPANRPPNVYSPWGTKPGTQRKGNVEFWFDDWQISGSKVKEFPERTFGPMLFSQYTLSKGTLKLTVQLPPIGEKDGKTVSFQTEEEGNWETVSDADIHELARTATFKIKNWDNTKDVPYRLVYELAVGNGDTENFYRKGTIRKEPFDKDEIVVAAFTGNNDLGFPNNELVDAVKFHDPDILFFSGDQIYEGVGGYGTQTNTIEKIAIDYLRKWYLYGWAYGDLMRDRPTIAIPDDHDVYHGNIWGAGGIATTPGLWGGKAQDAGGYKYFPEWVNMVERTQTSHLPDPYDATPVEQSIGVYYCDVNYAGISMAVIEDRKFKSAPKPLLPEAKIHNGWAQNRNWNAAKDGDVKSAILLGNRQLEFLDSWSSDWANKTWMKVVLSQTIFANVATLPREKANHDAIVPRLKIFNKGEYPPDDIPVQDMDSNGWPQSPRDKAISIIRKAFAFHIAGDQHLGSTIQYGVDEWNDGGYALCVPSISNVWPRRWFPAKEGKNRKPDMPRYSGDFKDGFGNLMTVHAVSNPVFTGKKPARLYDRATGYGIVRFNRNTRDINIECWPRWVDPSKSDAQQYPGWPININQMENYNPNSVSYLPTLKIIGMENPVVQIINEKTNEIIYTIRINGDSFTPNVFEPGTYTIKVGELETDQVKILKEIKSISDSDKKVIEVNI